MSEVVQGLGYLTGGHEVVKCRGVRMQVLNAPRALLHSTR